MNQQSAIYVQAETYTKRFVKCPICKDKTQGFYADHLLMDAKPSKPYYVGPWQCDGCNNHFLLKVHIDGLVEIAQAHGNESFVPCLVLLKSKHKDPIYFMLNAKHHQGQIDLEMQQKGSSATEFFYNEHTCPTNWINEVIAVAHQGDTDPHGSFEFVRLLSIPGALAIAKAHAEEFDLKDYESIEEIEIEDAFEGHVELLFPECIISGNDYEGSIENPRLAMFLLE